MKSINIVGKKMPILVVIMSLLVLGTASAAITYFAFSGEIGVESPFNEVPGHEFSFDLTANDNEQYTFDIDNNANTPILVELETVISCEDDGGVVVSFNENDISVLYTDVDGIMLSDLDGDSNQELVIPSDGTEITVSVHTGPDLSEGIYTITTSAIAPEDVDFIGLTSKDPSTWEPNGLMEGYVIYEKSSDEFDFCLKAIGDLASSEYSLIYYADEPNRYEDWGGIGDPSRVIVTVETGVYQDLPDGIFFNSNEVNAVNIGHDLPHPDDDANADPSNHDYRGAPDYYSTSTGAKLWLVPSDSFDEETGLIGWHPAAYLYDYELVNYVDSDGESV